MASLLLILGMIVVRVLARILENANRIVRALVGTAIGVGVGFWAMSVEWGSTADDQIIQIIDSFTFVPILLGLGTACTLVTLGTQDDEGYWNEYFSIGDTSFGDIEGNFSLFGHIFWVVLISGVIYLVCFCFSPTVKFAGGVFSIVTMVLYFGAQAFCLLKILFTKGGN